MSLRVPAAVAAATLLLAVEAAAHEIVLRPAPGEGTRRMLVESTHVFVKPEEREEVATLTAALVTAAGTTPLPLGPAGELSLAAELPAPAGPAWFVAHRLPLVYSNTPAGFRAGTRTENPDAIFTNRYEKFSKALIDGSDAGFVTTPLGHRLEIVPLANPAGLRAGDELRVQVLHDGRPVAASVMATFDGFSETPMTFAYATETSEAPGETGIATVKLWSPGYWYVRVAHEAEDPAADVDTHVLRAILSFEVK